MRATIGQINTTNGDFEGNTERILRAIEQARREKSDLIVFPEVAVKMAEVGESTGALQDMLNTVADFYDEEIATNMERFVTLVEPILLVIMGMVIAGLLLALYMPLFQLSSVLNG